jgi:alpha-L-rhamnosidase
MRWLAKTLFPTLVAAAICWLLGPQACNAATAGLAPADLRCEYRVDPVGIDVTQPRLSWTLGTVAADAKGLTQAAYQVLVAGTPEKLAADHGDLWDSGKVESNQQLHIAYAGKPLASRMRCHWKVRVWDHDGKPSGWSKPAMWAMGLLETGDWQGKWIAATDQLTAPGAAGVAGDHALEAKKEVPNQPGNAAVLLRKEIRLDGKVTRATAFLCGLGYSELEVNGRKIGADVLDPGFTDFIPWVCALSRHWLADLCSTSTRAGQNRSM